MFTILNTCKGGGYVYCRTEPPHPRRNAKGLYPLHRVLAENMIGRLLLPNEEVHHEDGCKDNNDPSNLRVLTKREHASEHRRREAKEPVSVECAVCGSAFQLKPHQFRLRLKRAKTGQLFCSRSCGTIAGWRRSISSPS